MTIQRKVRGLNKILVCGKLFLMFAIIKTGGKQYIVQPGDKIKVEKLETPEGKEVVFDRVLLVSDKETAIGTPYLIDYIVKGKVLRQGKGKKIIVYKYKPKKRYHKKQGHRQLYAEVEILSISAPAVAGQAGGVKKVAKATKPKGAKSASVAKTKIQAAAKKPAAKKTAAVKKKAVK